MRDESVGHFHKMAPLCIVDKSIPSSFVPQPTHPHPPKPMLYNLKPQIFLQPQTTLIQGWGIYGI